MFQETNSLETADRGNIGKEKLLVPVMGVEGWRREEEEGREGEEGEEGRERKEGTRSELGSSAIHCVSLLFLIHEPHEEIKAWDRFGRLALQVHSITLHKTMLLLLLLLTVLFVYNIPQCRSELQSP